MNSVRLDKQESLLQESQIVRVKALSAALRDLGEDDARRYGETNVLDLAGEALQMVMQCAFTHAPLEPDAFSAVVREILRHGLTNEEFLGLYRSALEHAWRILLDVAEGALLLLHAEYFFQCVRNGESFIAALADLPAESVDVAETLSRLGHALLRGDPLDGLQPAVEPVLAPTYLVAVVPFTGRGETYVRGVSTVTRQHLEAIRRRTGVAGMTVDREADVVLLLPVRGNGRSAHEKLVSAVRTVFSTENSGVTCGLAVPMSRSDIPTAVKEAAELGRVAAALEYAPGAYMVEEIMLEVMLYRAPDVASRLAAKLTPLTRSGSQLVDTLEVFLQCDQERKTAARRLFIHPNTLSYRLRRIEDLTHLSPTNSRDVGVLRAALIASRIVNAR
ncbi:PucR family transcriptional regulator [Streptomyces sp. NPDC006658]|uniref:PucR family transcriptional regulator n=1 Tax=Streptomyces sp. NPDC006658 TaxID=3156900 RepID=UPI0033C22FF5